jgi:hypothetical protein
VEGAVIGAERTPSTPKKRSVGIAVDKTAPAPFRFGRVCSIKATVGFVGEGTICEYSSGFKTLTVFGCPVPEIKIIVEAGSEG